MLSSLNQKQKVKVNTDNHFGDWVTFTGPGYAGTPMTFSYTNSIACLVNRWDQGKYNLYNTTLCLKDIPRQHPFMFVFIMCFALFEFTPQKQASSHTRWIYSPFNVTVYGNQTGTGIRGWRVESDVFRITNYIINRIRTTLHFRKGQTSIVENTICLLACTS